MSNHRLATPRRRRSGRTRALLSLGAVAVLATGMSVKGTFAFWTDSATASTGSFSSGTLDITLNGQLNTNQNLTSFKLDTMVPGESYAVSFPVKNDGTVPLSYKVTGVQTGPLAVTNGLQYAVYFGTAANNTAANTGAIATGDRTGKCGTTAATDTTSVAVPANTTTTIAPDRTLGIGASETVCIIARFSSLAGNDLQTKTGTSAVLTFDAKQLGGV